MKVLLIDDHALFREGLVRLLTEASRSSYTTEAAEIVRAVGENF